MAKRSPVVRIIGADAVASKLKGDIKVIQSASKAAMKDVSLFLEAEIKASVAGQRAESRSVDTGRFLNSVSSQYAADNAVVFSTVEYAPYLEYGTSRGIRARNHFRNAASRNEKKIVGFVSAELKKALK